MVRAYVVCNCPHSNAMMDGVRAGWEQRLRSWYMLFFQGPNSMEKYWLDFWLEKRLQINFFTCVNCPFLNVV